MPRKVSFWIMLALYWISAVALFVFGLLCMFGIIPEIFPGSQKIGFLVGIFGSLFLTILFPRITALHPEKMTPQEFWGNHSIYRNVTIFFFAFGALWILITIDARRCADPAGIWLPGTIGIILLAFGYLMFRWRNRNHISDHNGA